MNAPNLPRVFHPSVTKPVVNLSCFVRYAKSVGAKHHHTSAKLNRGIEELFLDLSQQMIAKADQKPKNGSSSGSRSRGNNITIADDSQLLQSRQKSGCCGGGGGAANNDASLSNDLSTRNNLSESR